MQRYLRPKTISDQINEKFKVIFRNKAAKITEHKIKTIRSLVAVTARNWRLHIRFLLSRKYIGGINNTLYPKMRTGALRDSVPRYIVRTNKTYYGTAILDNETVISLKRRPLKAPWNTYGEELNRWPTQLGGWKERAYTVLNSRVEQILRKGK